MCHFNDIPSTNSLNALNNLNISDNKYGTYLWLEYYVNENEQVFINYATHHISGDKLTIFGFIDNCHINDIIDLLPTDPLYSIKNNYFNIVWNTNWLVDHIYKKQLRFMFVSNDTYINNINNKFKTKSEIKSILKQFKNSAHNLGYVSPI